jgi:molybdate-binding protein
MSNRIEAELLKNLNNQNSLEDVLLMSQGSAEITNLILMKIINRQHNIHVVQKSSTCCQILDSSAAA